MTRAQGGGRGPRLLRPARQETYEKLFSTVYAGLMTNFLLAVTCVPLLAALAIVRDPLTSWPFFAVLSLPCAPALAGAFGCFKGLGEGSADVVRTFWRSYRRAASRAVLVWAAGAAAVSVMAVDVAVVAPTGWGPALVPFFATVSALVMTVVFALLVLLAETPRTARLRPLL
ncbi:MAG: ferredoxin-NADPH reductase, partial [Catenulispora sp.]|nr:ferredoxin-NADPH reductase [Catenulispora sp.]